MLYSVPLGGFPRGPARFGDMAEFTSIGVIGRPGHNGAVETLQRLQAFLESKDRNIVFDEVTACMMQLPKVRAVPVEELASHCDLVIVVGGDGSLLHVAKHVYEVPVIGVNRGRLGFLTDVLPDEIEQRIGEVLDGRFVSEDRFLLDAEVVREGSRQAVGRALNDVVLHPGKAAQMISFELFIDGQFVYSQESDGLIVATPTGSTAYALSAGGPIMHPQLDALVLVPMYPHSLSSRPLAVNGDSEVRLVVGAKEELEPQLSCDGQVRYTARAGDEIFVRKNSTFLKLIHPLDYTSYQACRSKLGWGSRLAKTDD